MRNLKRALSLTLASIMLLGMMVVGSSAASYQDVTDEHNVEAIEVLQAVGIMVGDEGNFNPEKNVTRNEMAVIMSNLMDYRVATYAGTSPFTDVPSWAEPYVAACYTNGITSGTSATTYNGSGNVTTAQAALMVMKALGYFQTADDFKGDWQLATTRQANSIDLLVGVKAGVREAMTRNDVAQLVLNGLESGIVEVDSNNSVSVSVGEAQVNINGNKYVYVTSGQDYAHAIDRKLATANDGQYSNGFIVELGEKLYQGSLTKDSSTGYYTERNNFIEGNTDDFGRPADHWEYQGKAIGTYVIDPSVEAFTKKVTTKTLYNAVGSAACNYEWHVEVDGVEVNNTAYGKEVSANKTEDNDCFLKTCGKPADALNTGNGTLTQVYVDGTNRIVHVSVIHYYAAEVLRVNNADGKDRSITLSNLDSSGKATTNDVFETEDFTEDDIVAYSFADNTIQEVYATERLEGKVTQARAREDENAQIKDGDHFTVDETKYNYNTTVPAAAPRRLTTENVNNNMVGYLDQFGYVIYIDDAAATYDYAYVLTMGSRNDDYGPLNSSARASDGKTWYARLVLTDGTMLKVETDAKSSDVNNLLHHLVSYSVDSKGVYSLISRSDEIGNGSVKVDTGAAGIKINNDNFVANNDTVFIIADSDKESADDYNFRVYTGIKNVPDVESWADGKTYAVAAKGTNGVAKVVYIQDADVSGTKNVIFIKANAEAKFDKVTGSSRCYIIDAVEDGEVVTLRVKEGSEAAKKLVTNINTAAGFAAIDGSTKTGIVAAEYLNRDADGVVTNVKLYDTKYDPNNKQDEGYDVQTGTWRAERGTVGIGPKETRYGFGDNTIVVRYDVPSGNFYFEKNLNGIKDDADDVVLGIVDTGSLTGICYLNTTKTGAGVKPGDGSGSTEPSEVTGDITVPGETDKKNFVAAGKTYGTIEVNEYTQKPTLTVNFKAPAWAEGVNESASSVNFTYKVLLNGKTIDEATTTATNYDSNSGVYTMKVAGASSTAPLDQLWEILKSENAPKDAKVTVEISNVKWTNANVKYVYDTKDGADASTAMGTVANTGNSFKTMKVGAAEAGFKFTFTLPGTRQLKTGVTKATYEIVGATKATGETVETTGDITDASAVTFTTGLKANGGDYVYVIIKDTEAKPAAATKTVTAAGSQVGKLEFAVSKTDVDDATKLAAVTEWGPSVEAAANDYVLVRAKDRTVGLTGITTANNADGGTVSAATSAADVASDTGVLKFQMPATPVDVNIYAVTTNAVSVTGVYVSASGNKINAISSVDMTDANQEKIAEAIVAYINGHQSDYSLNGLTASVAKDIRGNVIGVTFGGTPVAFSAITAKDTEMVKVKVNGTNNVVIAENNKTVGNILGWESVSVTGGAGSTGTKVYITLTRSGDSTTADNGTWGLINDRDGHNVVVKNGDVIDTNGVNGYAKVDVATNKVAAGGALAVGNGGGAVTITAGKVDIAGISIGAAAPGALVKVGEAFTVSATGFDAVASGANTTGAKLTNGGSTGIDAGGIAIVSDEIDSGVEITNTTTIAARITLSKITDDVAIKLIGANK